MTSGGPIPVAVSYKVVVLGSSGVGKTSIVHRLMDNAFLTDGTPTCGADFHSYTATANGQCVKLQIWDTAGQERFRAISKAYFRNAVGAVLVFDITRADSFDDLVAWLRDLEALAAPNACVILAANTTDREAERRVGCAEVRAFAERHHIEAVETSASSGENIALAFSRLALELLMRVRDGKIEVPQLALAQAPVEIPAPARRRPCC
jgi:small GTP-binding protein